jgi:hypothetical protein
MKNAVFWNRETQFVPHRRHITSPLQSPAGLCYVKFEFFTAATMKNCVFWDIKTRSDHTRFTIPIRISDRTLKPLNKIS